MDDKTLPKGTRNQLREQFQNPSDILSLLLLIGGDVVQRAISQMFGFYVEPIEGWPKLYITPVAFSFGWVGYAFTSMSSVIGDKQLMPAQPDCPSKIIECQTGYARVNRSWMLGRLLRDHELAKERDPGPEIKQLEANNERFSLRIDLFDMSDVGRPRIDHVWVIGWVIIIAQLGISTAPWILYDDWGVFLVTASGTAFALVTGGLRQWKAEKWPGRRLNEHGSKKNKSKVICLTRGNGHRQAMVIHGDGTAWDLESLATASSKSEVETPFFLVGLGALWTCLLIAVSGLKENTWFLIGIGTLGMLQNIYAASAERLPETLGMKLTPHSSRPCIIAKAFDHKIDDPNSDEDMTPGPSWRDALSYDQTPGVRGAIQELEKTYSKAGAALMLEFFPALHQYEPERYRTNKEKKFWKKAFRHVNKPVV